MMGTSNTNSGSDLDSSRNALNETKVGFGNFSDYNSGRNKNHQNRKSNPSLPQVFSNQNSLTIAGRNSQVNWAQDIPKTPSLFQIDLSQAQQFYGH